MKKLLSQSRHKVRNRFIIETIAIFFIIMAPFIFMLHGYLSRNPDSTLEILGFTIDRNGFPNIRTYIWFLLGKIIPFYLLAIWFFTSKQWWYHIILIPMLMYAFQTFEVIFSDDNTVDTENIWWLLPVCMVVIPFVYLIRVKLYDRYVNGIDLEAMEAELHALKEKQLKEKKVNVFQERPMEVDYRSLSEWLNQKLSTGNIEFIFRQFQNNLRSWFHIKF